MATQLKPVFRTSLLKHKTQSETPFKTSLRTPRFQVINASIYKSKEWQLIQCGTVRPITSDEASTAINRYGYTLLDVRPTWEREKARVPGSLHVPIFLEVKDNSPVTLLKKLVHFGFIGLWTGQYLTIENSEFLSQVENAISDKDTRILVACGEGSRSITAASRLYNGGHKNLGWLVGGFSLSKESEFPAVEGKEKLQYATFGGVSYIYLQLFIFLDNIAVNLLNM